MNRSLLWVLSMQVWSVSIGPLLVAWSHLTSL